MAIETVREFFGWCLAINVGLMFFSLVAIMSMRDWACRTHAKMFHVDEAAVRSDYFRYFANYKITVIVFNLVPYIALSIMGGG